MLTERDLRELGGFPAGPEITFLGEAHPIREDGLAALLRYARASSEGDKEGGGLAAAHRLLEDCVTDFPRFAAAAMAGKAQDEDIQGAVRQLVEFYCVRKYWPAMRLIGYVALNLDEADGQMIRSTGRGLVGLSAREVCNMTLAKCLEGLPEDEREIFIEDLEYEGNPEAEALAMVRQMQADKAAREAQDAERERGRELGSERAVDVHDDPGGGAPA
jgi:hypothetical protein